MESAAMKNLRSSFLNAFLFLALSGGLAACAEDKKEDPAPAFGNDSAIPRSTLLAGDNSKNWLLTAWTITNQGIVTDSYLTLDNCEKDNVYQYSRNYEFQNLDGQVKCPLNPQIRNGYWSLQRNETEIKHTFPGGSEFKIYRIKQLTNTTLVLEEVLKILA